MLLCNSKTALKMKLWIKDFFSTCDQIRRKLYVYSYLQKKFLMETFIFCQVQINTGINGRNSIYTHNDSMHSKMWAR